MEIVENDKNHRVSVGLSLPSLAGYGDGGRIVVVGLVCVLTWWGTPPEQVEDWREFAGGLLAGLAAAPSGAGRKKEEKEDG